MSQDMELMLFIIKALGSIALFDLPFLSSSLGLTNL